MGGFTLYVIANILTAIYGIITIIMGSKSNSIKEIKHGIAVILFLILIRFLSSDLSFYQKSVIFISAGICFMIGANIIKKRIGGKKDEE